MRILILNRDKTISAKNIRKKDKTFEINGTKYIINSDKIFIKPGILKDKRYLIYKQDNPDPIGFEEEAKSIELNTILKSKVLTDLFSSGIQNPGMIVLIGILMTSVGIIIGLILYPHIMTPVIQVHAANQTSNSTRVIYQ